MSKDTELYELCKEVYKRTKWDDYCEYWSFGGEYTVDKDSMTSIEVQTAIIPLYISDYLLEKLPNDVILKKTEDGDYRSYAPKTIPIKSILSDTPLKALLKLTIALSEAGVKL